MLDKSTRVQTLIIILNVESNQESRSFVIKSFIGLTDYRFEYSSFSFHVQIDQINIKLTYFFLSCFVDGIRV